MDFMLAESIDKLGIKPEKLADYGYIYQNKYDGERCFAICDRSDGEVTLTNRRGFDKTETFFSLLNDLRRLPNCVIDGEIVVLNGETSDFLKLLSVSHTSDKAKLEKLNKELNIVFIAFDILELDGKYLGVLPYRTRYDILKGLPITSKVQVIQNYEKFEDIWNAKKCKEGVIAKRLNSLYHQGQRKTDWLKVKKWCEEKVWFDGYELHDNEAGITLTNKKGDRISVGCEEVAEEIKATMLKEGKIQIECQYLEETADGLMRFGTFKRIVERWV